MVLLISNKEVQEIAPWKEATRSGLELVPALIRNAGTKAVESYLCFFTGLASRHTGYVMRAATKRFFQWAEEAGISLDGLRAGHINDFFSGAAWKPSTTKFYFGAIKRLFAHLEADRVIDRSPFVGVEAPKAPKQAKRREDTPYEEVCRAFCEQWGNDADGEVTKAAMVMVAPACIASFDMEAISRWSKFPLPTVKNIVDRLYKTGIWFREDGIDGIRCEWLDPECENQDFAMLMDAFVVVGKFDRDDELRYRLPKEQYEQMMKSGDR